MTASQRRLQSLQGGAAGEHNLPLVLSNLHFPWSLREVNVSSCFLSGGGGLIIHLCTWNYTLVFLTGEEEMQGFFVAQFSADLGSILDKR